jgi:hypothetical protein
MANLRIPAEFLIDGIKTGALCQGTARSNKMSGMIGRSGGVPLRTVEESMHAWREDFYANPRGWR